MTKSERNIGIFVVPNAVFYTVALKFGELLGPFSLRTFLQVYGFIIFMLCSYVVQKEYGDFFDVHERKDIFLDSIFLIVAALGMDYFIVNVNPHDLTNALRGLVIFFFGACCWEAYTMKVNNYFGIGGEPWTYWFRLLAEPRFPFRAPAKTLHRDEYRFWLIVDGAQGVILTCILVFWPSLLRSLSHLAILILAIIFIALQLVSVFRYLVVVKRWRKRATLEPELAQGKEKSTSVQQSASLRSPAVTPRMFRSPAVASPAHWSKEFVEHLRTVHFTLIAVCVTLLLLSGAHTKTDAETAYDQIRQIREFLYDDLQWFDSGLRKQFAEYKAAEKMPSTNGANVLVITVDDINIRSPFQLEDNVILRVPDPYESQLFEGDHLEDIPVTEILQTQGTLKQFRNMWDMLRVAYVDLPLDLSAIAYVKRRSEFQLIKTTVKFEKVDQPNEPSERCVFRLRRFSPRALELVHAQNSSFNSELYYGGSCPSQTGTSGPRLAEIVDVWLPIWNLPYRPQYEGQTALLSHAKPNWDWRRSSFDDSFRQLNEITKDYQEHTDLDTIEKIVRSEAQRSGESFEALGMKLSAEQALRWGIIVIIAVQLYFWLHLKELASLPTDGSGWSVAWIGVYSSRAAKAVMFITTTLLPIGAVLLVGIRGLRVPSSEWHNSVAFVVIFIIALVSSVLLAFRTCALLPRAERNVPSKEGPERSVLSSMQQTAEGASEQLQGPERPHASAAAGPSDP